MAQTTTSSTTANGLPDMESISRAMSESMDRSVKNGTADQETDLFGLVKLPTMIAGPVQAAVNLLSGPIIRWVQPRAYEHSFKLAEKMGLEGATLHRGATVAAVTASLAAVSAFNITPFFKAHSAHKEAAQHTAHAVAPVLDQLKGRHSVGALMSVKEEENSVIYAHRRRLQKQAKMENTNNALNLAINTAPNFLVMGNIKSMWNGEAAEQFPEKIAAAKAAAEKAAQEAVSATTATPNTPAAPTKSTAKKAPAEEKPSETKNTLWMIASSITGPLSTYIMGKNKKELAESEQECSTLDVILKLQKQLADDPKARSYVLPGKKRESCNLEQYIARVMIHHQREMSDIDPDYSELRPALKEELGIASKIIAESIREGDIGAMDLVRLVGEGRVIRNHGSSLASAEDIRAEIDQISGQSAAKHHTDPREYYANAAFSREDLKRSLAELKGEERAMFASWIPDEVLHEAGVSAEEIKTLREENQHLYDQHLADVILGSSKETDAQLKQHGMAESEIKILRTASKAIETKGLDALRDFKQNAKNPDGIELTLANMAVPQLRSKPEYLGTLIERGRTQSTPLPEATNEPRFEEEKTSHAERVRGHHGESSKRSDHASRVAANADHYTHAHRA